MCEVCDSTGLVEYTVGETEEQIEHKRMAACLCVKGQAKLGRVKSIARCLPVDDITELWPDGAPKIELISSRLREAEVPAAFWSWTLKSYQKKFGPKSAVVRSYVELAE